MKYSLDDELLNRIKKLELEKDTLVADIDIKKYSNEYLDMTLEEQNEFRIKILEDLAKTNNLLDKNKSIYFKSKFE